MTRLNLYMRLSMLLCLCTHLAYAQCPSPANMISRYDFANSEFDMSWANSGANMGYRITHQNNGSQFLYNTGGTSVSIPYSLTSDVSHKFRVEGICSNGTPTVPSAWEIIAVVEDLQELMNANTCNEYVGQQQALVTVQAEMYHPDQFTLNYACNCKDLLETRHGILNAWNLYPATWRNLMENCIENDQGWPHDSLRVANFEFKAPTVFPNPCEEQTSVKFELEEDTRVTVHLYNSMGHKVRSYLENEILGSGSYHVVMNLQELPMGVYYAQTKLHGQTYTNTVMKIK